MPLISTHRRSVFFTLFTLLLLPAFSWAQTAAKLSGIVQSADKNPLTNVTITLLKSKDSSLVKMAVSDKAGHYEFDRIRSGDYLLSYSSIGFTKAFSDAVHLEEGADKQLPLIVLESVSGELAAVTVVTRKPLVENRIDKMVVNVDASPTNAGTSALEVLEKSPGISVDKDGNISIKGKQGVIVLIDGKQTYLSGQDLANLLRNMPSNQLDQIEIMTQPSAKYDAAGNSGILNLRTKKNQLKGFNGSINLSYVQGRYPKSPNSFNFNYRSGKINVFTSLSYSYWSNINEQYISRKFHKGDQLTSVFEQNMDQFNESRNHSARVGLDYSLSKTTTVGVLLTAATNPSRSQVLGRADIFNGNNKLDSFNLVQNYNRDQWKNLGANVNFRKVLNNSGRELTADIDRVQYNRGSQQSSDNYNYYADNTLTGNSLLLRGNLPSEIIIYSGKADYVHPLSKEAKFEAGFKSSYVTSDNDAQYTLYDAGESKWAVDNSRSNRFKYRENINAAYINYSRQIKKWGIQTGLRVENTIANGDQAGNAVQKDSSFRKNYTQLFPTAYLSYALDEHNQFGFSYGRRIERPNYRDMNPFVYFLDQYTFSVGNPNLNPQFTHNFELSHNFHKSLNTALSYSATTDILNDVLKQNDQTKVTYQTKENVAKRQTLGLSISYSAALKPWWTTSIFLNGNSSHYEGMLNNTKLDVTVPTFMANMSQQFRFAKTWSAEVSGFYRTSAQETAMYLVRPMGVVSFGFGKQILNKKASLKLNITDPFYIQKVKIDMDYGNIDMIVKSRWDNRRVGLTFVYSFSKGQNTQQRRKSSGTLDEQNRVGGN